MLGTQYRIHAYSFGVVQSNKIRGCDDYCRNEGNSTLARSELLRVTATVEIIARINRRLPMGPLLISAGG